MVMAGLAGTTPSRRLLAVRSFVRLCARVDRRVSSRTHPSNRSPPHQSVQDGLQLELVRELLAFMDPGTVSLAARIGRPAGWTALRMAANGVDALGQRPAILCALLDARADASVPPHRLLTETSPPPRRHPRQDLAHPHLTDTSPNPHRYLQNHTAPMPHLTATSPKPQQ